MEADDETHFSYTLCPVRSGLCALVLPKEFAGPVSLVAILGTLQLTTGEPWGELIYPVFVTRLALVPVLMAVGTW